jgi:hypothetical protein
MQSIMHSTITTANENNPENKWWVSLACFERDELQLVRKITRNIAGFSPGGIASAAEAAFRKARLPARLKPRPFKAKLTHYRKILR